MDCVTVWRGSQVQPTKIGTLSNFDDDGSENMTKKMNLHPFKLYRVYLEQLNSSNVGDFSWSWILKGFIHVQIEKGNLLSYVHVLYKTSHWEVSRRSRAVDVQKCTKKRDARAELLFCS